MASKFVEDFDLEPNQASELNMLTSKQMVWKIAEWMAEKGVRPTQTDVGRLIHRHAGQTPSKTTLKEALDSFYAHALQTSVTRQSIGQIPSGMVDHLEGIYLQIKQACQLEFLADRESFKQVENLLKERIAQIDTERVQMVDLISQRDLEIEALKAQVAAGKSEIESLTAKTDRLEKNFSEIWNQKVDLDNELVATKHHCEAQLQQLRSESQNQSDSLKLAHQGEMKQASIMHAAELKKLGEANHAHTTRLLLQIDQLMLDSKEQAKLADANVRKLTERLEKTKTEKQKDLGLLEKAKVELNEMRGEIAVLKGRAQRTDTAEKQLEEANNTISRLTESISKFAAQAAPASKLGRRKDS